MIQLQSIFHRPKYSTEQFHVNWACKNKYIKDKHPCTYTCIHIFTCTVCTLRSVHVWISTSQYSEVHVRKEMYRPIGWRDYDIEFRSRHSGSSIRAGSPLTGNYGCLFCKYKMGDLLVASHVLDILLFPL